MFGPRLGLVAGPGTGGMGIWAREIDRLLDGFPVARGDAACAPGTRIPALSIWEDADRVTVQAEVPGFSMGDISVSMLDDELTISGKRAETETPEGVVVHRRERSVSGSVSFTRTIRLSTPINAEKVSATLDKGILAVTLPKTASAKPRTIAVTARPAGDN